MAQDSCPILGLESFLFKEVRTLGTSERRIETIKYLCRKRRGTMAEISKEFGVSVRTVQRDIDYLSGVMMIPIYCQSLYPKIDCAI